MRLQNLFWCFSTTLICFLVYHKTSAQSQEPYSSIIESLIENFVEESSESFDQTSLQEEFEYLLQYPLDLNSADPKDFEKLYILSGTQIQNLISYRKKTGKLLSIFELQLIPGFSYELIQKLLPFVTVAGPKSFLVREPERKHDRHLWLIRTQRIIEQQEGFKTYTPEHFTHEEAYLTKKHSRFSGNPWKYYWRYGYTSAKQNISFGVTAEKDPGEAFFTRNQPYGFDFYSINAQLKNYGMLKQINLGDYQLKFGQGLSLWSGFAQRKSVFTVQNAKKSQGISPYRSTDENRFFRGAAIVWNLLKNMEVSSFVSHKKRDASLWRSDTLQTSPLQARSLLNTGLHRNQNELDNKNAVRETVWGSNLLFNHNQLQAGVTYLAYQFSPSLFSTEKIYQLYDFSGSKNYNLSGYYQFHLKKMHFYGEAGISKSKGKAILLGLQAQAHPQFAFELLYRNYNSNYHAHYANAFGEQSGQKNEEGLYMGMELYPIRNWKISVYYDTYRFPWLRYRVDAPGNGYDILTQIDFKASSKVSMYFRYKQEIKPENTPLGIRLTALEKVDRQQFRFHLNTNIDNHWELRNRFELSVYQKENNRENGYLIYQDIIYRHIRTSFSVNLRFALFDTPSYNSRIYAYENDILYAFSVPLYYLKGIRTYVNLHCPIANSTDIYIKLAQTRFFNQESIGSGTSEIQGNTRTEIKFLLRLKI